MSVQQPVRNQGPIWSPSAKQQSPHGKPERFTYKPVKFDPNKSPKVSQIASSWPPPQPSPDDDEDQQSYDGSQQSYDDSQQASREETPVNQPPNLSITEQYKQWQHQKQFGQSPQRQPAPNVGLSKGQQPFPKQQQYGPRFGPARQQQPNFGVQKQPQYAPNYGAQRQRQPFPIQQQQFPKQPQQFPKHQQQQFPKQQQQQFPKQQQQFPKQQQQFPKQQQHPPKINMFQQQPQSNVGFPNQQQYSPNVVSKQQPWLQDAGYSQPSPISEEPEEVVQSNSYTHDGFTRQDSIPTIEISKPEVLSTTTTQMTLKNKPDPQQQVTRQLNRKYVHNKPDPFKPPDNITSYQPYQPYQPVFQPAPQPVIDSKNYYEEEEDSDEEAKSLRAATSISIRSIKSPGIEEPPKAVPTPVSTKGFKNVKLEISKTPEEKLKEQKMWRPQKQPSSPGQKGNLSLIGFHASSGPKTRLVQKKRDGQIIIEEQPDDGPKHRFKGNIPSQNVASLKGRTERHIKIPDDKEEKDWYKKVYKSLHRVNKPEEINTYTPTYMFPDTESESEVNMVDYDPHAVTMSLDRKQKHNFGVDDDWSKVYRDFKSYQDHTDSTRSLERSRKQYAMSPALFDSHWQTTESTDQFEEIPRPELYKPRNKPIRGKAKAKHNFTAQNKRELTLRRGDIVYLIRQLDRNWFEGERHGMVGLFPINYVEVILSLDEARRLASSHEGYAKALYDFYAQAPLELTFEKGDSIQILRKVDSNWYEGKIDGTIGLFPASYVDVLKEPDTPLSTPLSSAVPSRVSTPGPLSPGSTISYAPTIPDAPDPLNFSPNSLHSGGSHHSYKQQFIIPNVQDRRTPLAWERPSSAPYFREDPPRSDSRASYREPMAEPDYSYGSNKFATMPSQQRAVASRPVTQYNGVGRETQQNTGSEKLYKASFKYVPQNKDELALNEGDLVIVMEKCEDGWFVGTSARTNDFGTFPGNYVRPVYS